MNCKQSNPRQYPLVTLHFSSHSGDSQSLNHNDAEDYAMISALDTSSPLNQMLGLGGRSVGSLQGKEAAEFGSQLHSVRSRLLTQGRGAHLEIPI